MIILSIIIIKNVNNLLIEIGPIAVKEIDVDELSRSAGKQEPNDNELAYKPSEEDLKKLEEVLNKFEPPVEKEMEVIIEPIEPQNDPEVGKRLVYSKE